MKETNTDGAVTAAFRYTCTYIQKAVSDLHEEVEDRIKTQGENYVDDVALLAESLNMKILQ